MNEIDEQLKIKIETELILQELGLNRLKEKLKETKQNIKLLKEKLTEIKKARWMMHNEIEKNFFNAFGIEPKSIKRTLKLSMPEYDESNLPEDLIQFISSQAQVYHVYPQITDRILLELICIYNSYKRIYIGTLEVDHFRRFILSMLIDLYKETININKKERLKHQVQALFKEDV